MKKQKRKKPTGRPPLPVGDKREGVTIYPKLSTIIKFGGMVKIRKHLINLIEPDENQ